MIANHPHSTFRSKHTAILSFYDVIKPDKLDLLDLNAQSSEVKFSQII